MKCTLLHEDGSDYEPTVKDVDVHERPTFGGTGLYYVFVLTHEDVDATEAISDGDSATLVVSTEGEGTIQGSGLRVRERTKATARVSCKKVSDESRSVWKSGAYTTDNQIAEVLDKSEQFLTNDD